MFGFAARPSLFSRGSSPPPAGLSIGCRRLQFGQVPPEKRLADRPVSELLERLFVINQHLPDPLSVPRGHEDLHRHVGRAVDPCPVLPFLSDGIGGCQAFLWRSAMAPLPTPLGAQAAAVTRRRPASAPRSSIDGTRRRAAGGAGRLIGATAAPRLAAPLGDEVDAAAVGGGGEGEGGHATTRQPGFIGLQIWSCAGCASSPYWLSGAIWAAWSLGVGAGMGKGDGPKARRESMPPNSRRMRSRFGFLSWFS